MIKEDEYNLLLGNIVNICPKRLKYIYNKWARKGWFIKGILTNEFTDEFYRIRSLAREMKDNGYSVLDNFSGRVVTVVFKRYNTPQTIGILEDHGDNGYFLYTRKSCKYDMPYYIEVAEIAYIELHPNPQKIWRKLNYFFWKSRKWEDRFHRKIATGSWNTICDYSQAHLGIFTYSNPHGEIGSCFPYCQCKNLG